MADNSTDDMIIAIGVDVATIRRGLKKLEQEVASSTGKVQKQFETVGRGIDNAMTSAMQNRINAMVGIGTKGAKEWTGALADQGKELERLRAKYSPLFATINNYKSAVADIKRAHAVGAISADEMTAAIQRERQAALASTAAIKGRNAALVQGGRAGQGFQTANIAAQFQDIAVTSAMGMNPLQIALQQGTQLSSVLGTMGNGKQVIAGLGAAFASLVSPVSLVTIGLVAGGAAAIQYFSTMEWGGAKSEETLKKEAELVAAVASKWGEALPALKAYNDERQRIAGDQELQEALNIGKSAQWDDLRKALGDVDITIADIVSRIAQMGEDTGAISSLQSTFNELTKGIDDGTASTALAQRAQKELADVVKNNATPELEALLKIFQELIPAIDGASRAAQRFDLDDAIARTSRYPSRGTYGGVARNADGTPQGEGTSLPFSGPTPESRPLIELDGLPGADKAGKKAETAAQKAANAYRDLIKSADDRIGQLRLETELTGQYGVATDAARFRLELLQQSEDKGRSLSPTQRAEIEQKVALYEKYSQALAETKLQQDLLNTARFSSLSKQDQQVVSTLRQYGLPEDLGGKNAQAIRQSLQSEEINSAIDDFSSSLANSIVSSGGDTGEAFGKTFLAALQESAQKQLTNLFSQMLKGLFNSTSLGGGGAAPFAANTTIGALLGAGAAPVGAVSRSALPALPTGDIASYITQAAIKRGIDPAIALKVAKSEGGLDSWNLQSSFVKNGVREPSYGPYQLYMGGGLGNAFQKQTGLDPRLAANGPAGVDFALDNAKKSGWGAWYGAAKVGVGNWDGIGKGANTATAALEKMAAASTETTKGLGGLANSLASGLGGAGGGFDWGSLFSSSFKPNTTLSNFLNGVPGFATGTNSAPKGIALVGEKGPELVRFRGGEQVIPNNQINAPRAPRLAAANSNRMVRNETSLTVQIQGASGDDHVRMLVNQGVQTALRDQNEHMRRQGFGNIQQAYTTDRG
ncbi:hypothetical protein GR138_12050 [Shinella kummerowiae]|uniref:Bacteriophage tail tape measure N-terminal domain-containing protein n=1 Tax=Shinella kummerowiae TaxID=417745 RepID=A0A6N8SF23_9HYPH|nr:phage tail length tape measure family protein [Shinella kummerowiae]MXN45926.1 hypothetical protein [Shinella kummerowiae]